METAHIEQLISTGPAQILIAGVWQGLLLTACVWSGLKLAGAFGVSLRASTRFALWLIVFLLVAFLPALTLLRGVAQPVSPAAGYSLHLHLYWAFALEALWAVASLFSLARLTGGGLRMSALWKNSTPIANASLAKELQSVLIRPGARSVEIRLSDAIDAPGAIGFFRPAVIMPRSLWSELTQAELRQIVLHEMAHIERGDDWTNLLQKLLRALCPLNPALAWAERQLCRERERACDDAVLDVEGNARAYATCLTRLAESRLVRRAASLVPGLWKRPSELAGRVDNILHRRPTPSPLFSRGLLAASLLASLFGAVLLQRSPSLVAFTSGTQAATSTVAADNDLASAPITRVAYKGSEMPQAAYHDAVFHPSVSVAPVAPSKPVVTPHRRRTRNSRPAYSSLRLVELRGDGEMFTLVVFTIDRPQTARGTRLALPLDGVPTLSLSSTWISFQI